MRARIRWVALAEINTTLAPFTFERSIDEWVRLAVGPPRGAQTPIGLRAASCSWIHA